MVVQLIELPAGSYHRLERIAIEGIAQHGICKAEFEGGIVTIHHDQSVMPE
jgi:hypothetical protein